MPTRARLCLRRRLLHPGTNPANDSATAIVCIRHARVRFGRDLLFISGQQAGEWTGIAGVIAVLPGKVVVPSQRDEALEVGIVACFREGGFDWDWAAADRAYRRAPDLDPNYPSAHHLDGVFLCMMARCDEGLPQVEQARQLSSCAASQPIRN